jgi:predicted RNA-binding protein with PIN domain
VTSLLQVAGLRLLIDGYNVTRDARAVPDTGLEQQRAWLVRLVGGVVARFDVRPTLVFDGSADVEGAAPRARGVIVRFAVDETADELLVALLDGLPADEPVLVVTSDREICDAATIRDANSVSAAAFLEAVAP